MHRGESRSSKLHQFSKLTRFWRVWWGGCNSHQSNVGAKFLGFHEILFYFVFVAWLDAALLQQYMIASILKGYEVGCNCHQCIVGASFDGLCEPSATLALWLGWMQHYWGTSTLTQITQSSINKMHRGIMFLKAAPIQQVGKVLKGYEGVVIHNSAMLVLNFWDSMKPCLMVAMWHD